MKKRRQTESKTRTTEACLIYVLCIDVCPLSSINFGMLICLFEEAIINEGLWNYIKCIKKMDFSDYPTRICTSKARCQAKL